MELKEEAKLAAVMGGYVSEEDHAKAVRNAREIGRKAAFLEVATLADAYAQHWRILKQGATGLRGAECKGRILTWEEVAKKSRLRTLAEKG